MFPTLRIFCFRAMLFALVWPTVTSASEVANWNFSKSTHGWAANNLVTNSQTSPEGWSMDLLATDPFLTSPELQPPAGHFLRVTLRMRSTSDPLGQIYHGKTFSEENSRAFVVENDGQWHEYQIPVPPLEKGSRIRLDPGHEAGKVAIAWIKVESSPEKYVDPWARPHELRRKKMIGGGQYTTTGGERAVTSRFLAKHPRFTETFPFDGLVVPVVVDADWAEKLGLPKRDYLLHELLWNSVKIPYAALVPAATDLASVQWRGVTDNFLNYSLIDGAKGRFTPDLTSDADWAILEHNANMAARLCREARLQGFWLDTEQYGNYRWRSQSGTPEYETNRPTNLPFPLGKDTPDVLRRRGAQWIKAVQAEFPAVKIIITFAWSPDAAGYGPLKGVHGFFDGVLDGIEAPGQLIHGYENTFYYGQGPGTKHTKEGFPGDRGRFESARASMRSWRSFSASPSKYDTFVKIGMAAWVEDHPWNVWDGFPVGTKESFWSNLPLALAYTDEYVWVWTEHTQYGLEPNPGLNPFLASLRNRTFNAGTEEVALLAEDFATDPLLRGWHFDFDMLSIGKRTTPATEAPLMSTETIPYVWDSTHRAVRVRAETGPARDGQRQRYVHPIHPLAAGQKFRAALDFQIETFPGTPDNPILLGFFSSQHPIQTHSLALRLEGPNQIRLLVPGDQQPESLTVPIKRPLEVGKTYRVELENTGTAGILQLSIFETSDQFNPLSRFNVQMGSSRTSDTWDELGAALSESAFKPASNQTPYQYQLKKVSFRR